MMPKRKTLLDYVMKGGIEGKYFLSRVIMREGVMEPHVYQILGHKGIDNTIPANLLIKFCYLNRSYGLTEEERIRSDWLGRMLEDKEATQEEIEVARQERIYL